METPAVTEIQQADPQARHRALLLYLFCAFVGLVLLGAFSIYEEAIHDWLDNNFELLIANRVSVFVAASLLVAPLFVMSAYLWRYAIRCIDAERMPPPDYAVIRATPVRTGTTAIRAARILQVLALLIALSGATLPVLLWRMLSMFAG